jgi:hypothetical protein
MFFIMENGYSQPGKPNIDLDKLYETQLEEHLFPKLDTLNTNDVVLFIAKPSFSPEYSIRIIEHGGQSFIEGRFLEKILGNELLDRLMKHDEKPFSIHVKYFSVPISNNFKEKMITAFSSVINGKHINPDLPVDGIAYEFNLFNKKERVSSVEVISPEVGSMEDNVIKIFVQITNDLKTQSFDETKYIEKLINVLP